MLVFTYFFTTLLTVLMSSTVGTIMLVRSVQQEQLPKNWARAGIVLLALGLPFAVPVAVAAVFAQLIQYLPSAGMLSMTEATYFNFALFGAMPCALILCVIGAVSGLRRLRG